MSTQTKVKTKASDMFFLAAMAYLLTLIAPLFDSVIAEGNLVGALIFRVVCIAAWILGSIGIVKAAKKDCGFVLFDKKNKPSVLQWILTAVVTAAFVAYCLVDNAARNMEALQSLKGAAEIVYFVTYYMLIAVQSLVVVLIVALSQKGGDIVFGHGKWIPFGGIVVGLLWAAANLIGNIEALRIGFISLPEMLIDAGLMVVYGIIFGIIHLLMGNKTLYALPFMAVTFILM